MTLDPGHYDVVFSILGYETQILPLVIGEKMVELDIRLKLSDVSLDEIVVRGKKKDAAYEIIRNVIRNKKRFLHDLQSCKSEVYIKAVEEITEKEQKKSETGPISISFSNEGEHPFESQPTDVEDPRSLINMAEIQLELNFMAPDHYKEIRKGYRVYGNREGLFIPQFSEVDFNFYRNLIDLRGIAEVPVISPFSTLAYLTYKFRLEASELEDGMLVHRIRVTPRKSGNASCHGVVFINDGIWTINRLDLSFPKGGLKFFDAFKLVQEYKPIQDSLWLVSKQELQYRAKQGKRKTFNGNTLIRYQEVQPNYAFPDRFFGNEVSVITQAAMDRDSLYWQDQRTDPLSEKQQKVADYRDSITLVHKSQAYLDSTEKAYNKVTAGEILWHGVGFRNNSLKSDVYLTSLLDLIGFEIIGGLRLGPYANYFRRWENGRMLRTYGNLNVGVKNVDVQGNLNVWSRYNPRKLSDFSISFGRGFQSINSFDAYLNQLKRSNYILRDHFSVYHRTELLNGFYLQIESDYSARRSTRSYDSETFLGDIIEDKAPIEFEDYEALTTAIRLNFTPGQRYMTEPKRKVVLGSDFPTFELLYRKGWNQLLGSDIDWDYLEFGMGQDVALGALGNSKYTMRLGKFLNTRNVPYVDLLRFRQSDPILYSAPLHSFQLLDTSLSTTGLFFEAHHIHHFNGALINNLPIIKKLKLRMAMGGGLLYVKENNYRQQEVFAGVERIFKIGARRRMRIGIFGVLADSNFAKPSTGIKFSFDIIDTWKKDWSH